MNSYTGIDLFCGCGGMSKGLEESGIKLLAGIDVWDKAIESYSSNFNHLALCKNLEEFHPENLKNEYNITNIDIIAGSPFCHITNYYLCNQ